MTLPLTAVGGAALCAGGMTIVDSLATPGRQAVGVVTVSLQDPPEGWSETMQLRSICEDVPFRTFTVSPSAWKDIPAWETQIPIADGPCSTQVRLLPSRADWVDAPIQGGECTLSVDPLNLRC